MWGGGKANDDWCIDSGTLRDRDLGLSDVSCAIESHEPRGTGAALILIDVHHDLQWYQFKKYCKHLGWFENVMTHVKWGIFRYDFPVMISVQGDDWLFSHLRKNVYVVSMAKETCIVLKHCMFIIESPPPF